MSPLPTLTVETTDAAHDRYSFLCIACAAGFIAALIFLAFPGIDLAVSRLFYLGGGHFLFEPPGFGSAIRTLLRVIFWLACLGSVGCFILSAFFDRKPMGIGLVVWAYIALCAAIGPGLVANLTFKDHWGRARPVQVTEFGGTKQFTPPLLRTDQCNRNCSFFSGEASNFFALGFAIAFLAPVANRRRMLLAAIAAGSFAGLIRIGGGGHFLSDVIFAGVFMALVVRGIAWLVLERYTRHLDEGSPFHQTTLRLGRKSAFRALQLINRSRRYWRQKRPITLIRREQK